MVRAIRKRAKRSYFGLHPDNFELYRPNDRKEKIVFGICCAILLTAIVWGLFLLIMSF